MNQSDEPRSKVVLVLDDDRHMAAAFHDLLIRRGYQVCTAFSCEEALELLKSRPLDLLLADVNMPCMSGFSFVRQLKHEGLLAATPVIFVSAMARETDRQTGLSLADDYVIKPFASDDLIRRIEKVIAVPGGARTMMLTNPARPPLD